MRDKYKYLFKNTGLLMIGNFSSKILVFLLVPFYTNILTTQEYGSYDLIYSTIQLLMPILTLNIIDSVMRYSVAAREEEQCSVFSIGVKYVTISILALGIVIFILIEIFRSRLIKEYVPEFLLLYVGYTMNSIVLQFAKGLEDVKGIAVAGVLGTLTTIFGNLFFLLVVKIGLKGYFYAYIISFLIPAIYLIFKNHMLRYINFGVLIYGDTIEKEMLLYAVPLIFNTLSWNINSVADRYAVTYFCGIDINGIYSVSYKIPAILNAVQMIFIQAWQLSAIREYGNNKSFYKYTYNGCHIVMVLLCSFLIISTKVLAKLLFAKEFYNAWVYVPTLLIYIVFNTLSGTLGGIFSAVKDTGAFAKSAIAGALTNITLNIALVPFLAAEGAAIATVISSLVIWYMRLYYSNQYVDMEITFKSHLLDYILLAVQIILMTLYESEMNYFIQILLFFTILIHNSFAIRSAFLKIGGKNNGTL